MDGKSPNAWEIDGDRRLPGRASFGCERFMAARFLSLLHVLSTEIQLGGEHVVSATMKGQVRDGVCTLHTERPPMVELEVTGFSTAFAPLVVPPARIAQRAMPESSVTLSTVAWTVAETVEWPAESYALHENVCSPSSSSVVS